MKKFEINTTNKTLYIYTHIYIYIFQVVINHFFNVQNIYHLKIIV